MRSLRDNARELAQAHRRADPETRLIKFFPANGTEEIRLLEVSGAVPTTGEVLPFSFQPDPAHGVYYPSTVILLSPQEWQRIQNRDLELPPGWNIDNAEDF
jgi:hypothetical protein